MKSLKVLLITVAFLTFISSAHTQNKRINPPKKNCNIESVDTFVNNTFLLYHKVFVYDSLTKVNVEIPSDLEEELLSSMKKDLDSMWSVIPDIVEDMGDKGSALQKAKATLNLNKAKKALKFCMKASKNYIKGIREED